jgi:hypothetical protein
MKETMIARLFPNLTTRVTRYRDQLFTRLFGAVAAPQPEVILTLPARRSWLNRWSKAIVAVIAFGIYGALLYQAFKSWDPSVFQRIQFNVSGILMATAIQIVGYAGAVYLRKKVLDWLGHPLSLNEHQKIYAYSDLAAKLPGFFWGFASRIYLYSRFGVAKSAAGLAIALEIMTMGVGASLLCILIALFRPETATFLPLPVLVGALIICGAFTHPRVLRLALARLPNPPLLDALDRLSWGKIQLVIASYIIITAMGGFCLFGVVSSITSLSPTLIVTMIQIWSLTVVWAMLLVWLPVDFGLRRAPFVLLLSTLFPLPIVGVLWIVWGLWLNAIEFMWGAVALGTTLIAFKREQPLD